MGARRPVDVRHDYQLALRALGRAKIPTVVGGEWAIAHYADVGRATLDLDLMVTPDELERSIDALVRAGGRLECQDDVQATIKVLEGPVDLVHHLAQGVYPVGPEWHRHAVPARLFGAATLVAAPEEIVWSKIFVAARARFDGADLVHLLRATAKSFDWTRLWQYCAPCPELLLGFLAFFTSCYPDDRDLIPKWLWDDLLTVFLAPTDPSLPPICRGTLLDRESFDFDLLAKGFEDARLIER